MRSALAVAAWVGWLGFAVTQWRSGARAEEPREGILAGAPDPSAIALEPMGKGYAVFATGRGIPIYRSEDLVRWRRAGAVFEEAVPRWALEKVPGARGVWAPHVERFGGRYNLYYAVSTFGSQRSLIGLAANRTLDPESSEYRWEDLGEVIASRPGDRFNAIDPAAFVDEDGRVYLFWGSFWSGIYAVELDPATGKPREGEKHVPVADRREPPNAIEAPYVIFRDGRYYLFVSFDACCEGAKSTYKVMVGRSERVLGPYADAAGRPLLEGGGTLLLASHGRWRGPGHNSVLKLGERSWLVHHTYDLEHLERQRILQVRPLYWLEDGWPVVGEPLAETAGSPSREIAPERVAGTWVELVDYREDSPRKLELLSDGKIRDREGGSWSLRGKRLSISWKDATAPGGVAKGERILEPWGRSYAGRDERGAVLFGRKGE
ncbi:MAG: arabinan endo-1,5-alpha-L-arabinosidase [Planctomycetota bacterium]